MSPHLPSPFDLPHVVKIIAEPFLFKDLLCCLRVNRAWHDAFIPILWTDVYLQGHQAAAPHGHLALQKYGHYIRGLTCFATVTPILTASVSLDLLTEINFVLGRRLLQSTTAATTATTTLGLRDLGTLISKCPQLCAVSVERVDLRSSSELKEWQEFMKVVNRLPNVSCLFLSLSGPLSEKHISLPTILEERLAHVDSAGKKIKTLELSTGMSMTRSRRGLPSAANAAADGSVVSGQMRYWPGRDKPIETYYTEDMSMPAPDIVPGRSEMWGLGTETDPILAVLENDGMLQVAVPHDSWAVVALPLVARYPTLNRLYIDTRDRAILNSILDSIPTVQPDLRELGLSGTRTEIISTKTALHRILHNEQVSLTSISIKHVAARHLKITLLPLIVSQQPGGIQSNKGLYLRHALTQLGLVRSASRPYTHRQFLELVTNCVNLELLRISPVRIIGDEGDLSEKPWVCHKLHSLHVSFEDFDPEDPREDPAIQSKRVQIGHDFLHQLGTMTKLEVFVFSLDRVSWDKCVKSPLLDLSLGGGGGGGGVENGLEQLSKLSRLEVFKVRDVVHRVGEAEMAWIAKHWRRLRILELPILSKTASADGDKKREARHATAEDEDVKPLDFRPWMPWLRVRIPWTCILQPCCGWEICICELRSTE
ncbi:hypothetical protein BG004_004420 [Podila humilis]|nr:hypothetical protein BG004_004420 [Podila humilis]